MELIAATRPKVAYAYGASLNAEGTRLRCGLLFVLKGNTRKVVTLLNPETKERIRVRLPDKALKPKGHARFTKVELEVIP